MDEDLYSDKRKVRLFDLWLFPLLLVLNVHSMIKQSKMTNIYFEVIEFVFAWKVQKEGNSAFGEFG